MLRMISHLIRTLSNNRGEAGGDGGQAGGTAGDAGKGGDEKTFTQEEVNRFLAGERRNWSAKYEDYDSLKDFKNTHEKQQSDLEQKKLEEAGKFDEAKKTFEKQIADLQGVVSSKESAIKDMAVAGAISMELGAQNAYPEAAHDIRAAAVLGEDGVVRIKGKDANGLDTQLSVADGVKRLLETKPYLAKASGKSGADSGPGAPGGAAASGDDLDALGKKLQTQYAASDYKGAKETKEKINSIFAARQISRTP